MKHSISATIIMFELQIYFLLIKYDTQYRVFMYLE